MQVQRRKYLSLAVVLGQQIGPRNQQTLEALAAHQKSRGGKVVAHHQGCRRQGE